MLEADHTIGRRPSSSLKISERYISSHHAILRFAGECWELRDLGSLNGTFLNGKRLKPGSEVQVRSGAKMAFGRLEEEWELIEDLPPLPTVVDLVRGELLPIEGEMLALPSPDEPVVTIYRSSEAGWVLEQEDAIAQISNLQTFDVEGRAFRFSCPDTVCKTSLAGDDLALEIQHLSLRFAVSRDEEHVELRVASGSRTFDLGSRSHNYLLLTLARRRLADAAEGLSETSCGWVYAEDLAHDPSMAPPQLNIDVFRIRRQFALIGVTDPAAIIERRPRTHQVRIGVSQLSVVTL